MKHPFSNTKRQLSRRSPKQEQGLSLVLALMMGLVLTAGVTGLLIRQLTARKLAASESYQQMAETAALNGFNRMLSELNNDNESSYKGFLFTLDHNGGNNEIAGSEKWGWNPDNRMSFLLREPCTNRYKLPEAVPIPGSNNDQNPPATDLTDGSSTTQRDDGKDNIKLQYRLRGYETTATAENNGLGEGTFQIEGLVVRENDRSDKNFLARTLLLRSLYVSSIVAGEGDWAVLSGATLDLGDTQILKSVDENNFYTDRNFCASNVSNEEIVCGDGKVLLNISSEQKYTNTSNCNPTNLLKDVGSTSNNLTNRIVPILNKGLPSSSLWDLGKTQDRRPDSDSIRIWSFDDMETLSECKEIVCSRDSNDPTSKGRPDLVKSDKDEIRLSRDELCGGKGSDCHIYIEHINLSKTRLLIETSADRPVVLHLEYPGTSTVDPSEPNITGSINLERGSQLCGVNSGSSVCNGKPEDLIIFSAVPKPNGVRSCALVSPQTDHYVLKFGGNSLPHAVIHLIPGIVKTDSGNTTTLNGLIWSDAICNGSDLFELFTETIESGNVIKALNARWGWAGKNFPGYGQMVTRGVRGTGLDTFRRW